LQEEAAEQARTQDFIRGIYNQVFGNRQQPENFQSRYATPPPEDPTPYDRAGFTKFGLTTRKVA